MIVLAVKDMNFVKGILLSMVRLFKKDMNIIKSSIRILCNLHFDLFGSFHLRFWDYAVVFLNMFPRLKGGSYEKN